MGNAYTYLRELKQYKPNDIIFRNIIYYLYFLLPAELKYDKPFLSNHTIST